MDENLIYGWHPVFEALDAGKTIQKILIPNTSFNDNMKELWERLKEFDIPLQRVPKQKLDFLVHGANHQGVLAFLSPIEFCEVDDIIHLAYTNGVDPLLCLLNGVTDVRNLGAIARSAACFGIQGLVLPNKESAGINAETVKSSAGAILNLPVARVAQPFKAVKSIKEQGLQIVCLTEKANAEFSDCNFHLPTLLVLGDEGKGIDEDILAIADHQVRIEMVAGVASLNVSVAAGICFHEVMKCRK